MRLPGGGGYDVGPVYDVNQNKVGEVDELATDVGAYGEVVENWHGVDVNVAARLRNGLTIQGGTSSGRRLGDTCAARGNLPETYSPATDNLFVARVGLLDPYCRVVEPIRTSFRGLASYTIPTIGVQVSGTWSSDPGDGLAANYVATNAVIVPSLGRTLSSGQNVTVNLIRPGTFYGARRNNLDFRVAKILRFGRTRTQFGVDLYNVTNTDVVTGYNQTYSPTSSTWLTPTAIQPARYVKVTAQVDF